MKLRSFSILCCLTWAWGSTVAQPAADPGAALPPPLAGEEQIEPEVTITEDGDTRVEEYRVGGQLYMVKVVPSKGLPYYLVDNDGDGQLETRRNDLDPDVMVPRWTILRF